MKFTTFLSILALSSSPITLAAPVPSPDDGQGYNNVPSPDDGQGYTTMPSPNDGQGYTSVPSPDEGQGYNIGVGQGNDIGVLQGGNDIDENNIGETGVIDNDGPEYGVPENAPDTVPDNIAVDQGKLEDTIAETNVAVDQGMRV